MTSESEAILIGGQGDKNTLCKDAVWQLDMRLYFQRFILFILCLLFAFSALALLVGVRKSCSVLFLRAGVQPTLDPYAKAFYIQAHFASPGRGGVWLMIKTLRPFIYRPISLAQGGEEFG